jgi:peptidoglycan/xylan/chitin deacetylase (PgdA/CDA1 family)
MVLVYHGVSPHHPSCVDPVLFREHIEYLSKRCRLMSLEGILELEQCEHANRPAVAITFDDAYEDLLENALPVLSEHQVPAVIYTPTGYLGKNNDWDYGSAQPLMPIMTAADVQCARSRGFEIGSHTRSHVRLRGLDAVTLQREIGDSKKMLEDLLGEQVRTFAYPHGGRNDFDGRAVDAVREAGYRSAVTTFFGRHNDPSHRYEVRRIIIWPGDTTHELQKKIDGHYDWLTFKEIAVYKVRAVTGRTLT